MEHGIGCPCRIPRPEEEGGRKRAGLFFLTADLERLLKTASAGDGNEALAMAVINRQIGAVRLCLEASADPNLFMPCHKHSMPPHQAGIHDDVPMLKLLGSGLIRATRLR